LPPNFGLQADWGESIALRLLTLSRDVLPPSGLSAASAQEIHLLQPHGVPRTLNQRMNIERIKELLQAQPFRPFRLRTADGKGIPVLQQEIVFLEPKADVVIVTKEKGGFYIMEAMKRTLGPRRFSARTGDGSPTTSRAPSGAAR
jgi:hypothetical protein